MGRFLKFLVVVLLLLSIAAVIVASMVFSKREILKGLVGKYQDAVIKISKVVEEEPAKDAPAKTAWPERDKSPATADSAETPVMNDFWTGYSSGLEVTDLPVMDLSSKRQHLNNYYKLDSSGSPQIDTVTGRKIDSGDGTAQGALEQLLNKAQDQYLRLNETRAQLKTIREEYVVAVGELNAAKKELRTSLAKAATQEKHIAELETEVEPAKQKAEEMEAKVADMETAAEDLEREIDNIKRTIDEKDSEIARLRDKVKEKDRTIAEMQGAGISGSTVRLDPGIKGMVTLVNKDWNFVLIELNDKAAKELLGDDLSGEIPPGVELMVCRTTVTDDFVTKVRLTGIRKGQKVAIGDVLPHWNNLDKLPVREGDMVIF